jgi:NAD(P)-dependent dehydrogenase (short-subunit alcohol dehydrogenase family)
MTASLSSHCPTDRIQSFLCDVSSSTAVSTTANAIRSSMGNPTMLVNNAGITKAKLLLDLTEKDVMQCVPPQPSS